MSAQFDKKKQPIRLELKSPFEKTDTNTSNLPSIEFKSIFDKDDNYLKKFSTLNSKEEPKKSILDTSTDFKNPGDEIKEKLNREIEREGSWEDVFYGRIIVYTPTIKIQARDFGQVDGDRVQIILNEVITVSNLLLGGNYCNFYTINLKVGDNFMDILALNQGLVGDNTADFVIYDGNGKRVASDEWFLKKGVKQKFIIEYRKTLESNK